MLRSINKITLTVKCSKSLISTQCRTLTDTTYPAQPLSLSLVSADRQSPAMNKWSSLSSNLIGQ